MASGLGTWLLVALNAAVLLAAVGVAGYVLRRREAPPAAEGAAWRDEAAALAREVQQAAEPSATPADPDQVARRLLPLAGRIQGHVRAAPASVEEGTYRGLFELGVACQRVAVEHRPAGRVDGPFLEDRLESLRAEADAVATAVAEGYSKPRSNTKNAT